jgi:hypothetical protein
MLDGPRVRAKHGEHHVSGLTNETAEMHIYVLRHPTSQPLPEGQALLDHIASLPLPLLTYDKWKTGETATVLDAQPAHGDAHNHAHLDHDPDIHDHLDNFDDHGDDHELGEVFGGTPAALEINEGHTHDVNLDPLHHVAATNSTVDDEVSQPFPFLLIQMPEATTFFISSMVLFVFL